MTTPLEDAQALANALHAAEASDPKTSAAHTEHLAKLHTRLDLLAKKYQATLGFNYGDVNLSAGAK